MKEISMKEISTMPGIVYVTEIQKNINAEKILYIRNNMQKSFKVLCISTNNRLLL